MIRFYYASHKLLPAIMDNHSLHNCNNKSKMKVIYVLINEQESPDMY